MGTRTEFMCRHDCSPLQTSDSAELLQGEERSSARDDLCRLRTRTVCRKKKGSEVWMNQESRMDLVETAVTERTGFQGMQGVDDLMKSGGDQWWKAPVSPLVSSSTETE